MAHIFLRAAKVVTGKAREVIENGVVEIADGHIGRIGSATGFALPSGAISLDLGRQTILPVGQPRPPGLLQAPSP